MRRSSATPALAAVIRAGVWHEVHTYVVEMNTDLPYGLAAAAAMGVEPSRVFKTLVAQAGDTNVVAVIPVAASLDLRALARAVGSKKAKMADEATAERASGSVVGGISPLGHRTPMPVLLDASAIGHDTIYVSAGKRGLELEIKPADLVSLARGTVTDLIAD